MQNKRLWSLCPTWEMCALDLSFRRNEVLTLEVWHIAVLSGTTTLFAFSNSCELAKERRREHCKSCDVCRRQV